MITSYSFGRIVVDGREFRKDLIILPDGSIHHPWWRETGHRLSLADIGPVLEAAPEILVVGMGSPGLMKPESGLVIQLADRGITVKAKSTRKAVLMYNALREGGEDVAACFHLTC